MAAELPSKIEPHPVVVAAARAIAAHSYTVRRKPPGVEELGEMCEVAAVAAPAVLRAAAEMWDAIAERIEQAPAENLGQEWDRYQQQEHAVGVAEWLRNQATTIDRGVL